MFILLYRTFAGVDAGEHVQSLSRRTCLALGGNRAYIWRAGVPVTAPIGARAARARNRRWRTACEGDPTGTVTSDDVPAAILSVALKRILDAIVESPSARAVRDWLERDAIFALGFAMLSVIVASFS